MDFLEPYMTAPASPELQLPRGLIERARMLIRSGGRRLLGIAGTPGAGKSTVAQLLAEALGEQAIVVPMDGFHLANRELARLGRAERKGAPDTFDAEGYIALLQRLRQQQPGQTVYAPLFDRELEESLAGAIAVSAEVKLVISEGNYLLLPEAPWAQVAECFDDTWFVAVGPTQRRARLVERHMRFGRSREEAEAWVTSTDEPNAELVDASRARANVMVPWAG
jgi:pantothenate kinase